MLRNNLLTLLACFALFLMSCSPDDTTPVEPVDSTDQTYYFLGIEAATDPATDVLTPATSLEEGLISPVGNGEELSAWMTFIQGMNQIFVAGYTSAPEFISYSLVDGALVRGESFFTDLGIYAHDIVDEKTMVLMGSAREGLTAKKIYQVNTETMTIEKTVEVDFGNDVDQNLLAFPVDMKVRDNKLFVAYYMISALGDFSTPDANQARVAVFSYPELNFETIITDDRTPNLGRYYTTNALEIDEEGDIYTFAPSSLACGYAPVPATNSGVLRIKNGENNFDADYHIDFETLSGGYKINDMHYVADSKAVVRVVLEDETNPLYLWGCYAPTSPLPLISTGILDLKNETFTLLSDIPASGGGWAGSYLVEGTKCYIGVSNSELASIYVIDVVDGSVSEGASIEGNYAKGILSINQ